MLSSENPAAANTAPVEQVGDELLYQSPYTRVSRRRTHGGERSVILKELLGPDGAERMRREVRILTRLAAIAGVPQIAGPSSESNGITFEDAGCIPLRKALPFGQLDVLVLVEIALGLARVVQDVHRSGVVHKDICPANILLGPKNRPMLIDFDIATTTAEERPVFSHHSKIAGTLAYIAPEQTGRTGRAVDQRADLYSLGATLYELAVGRPPFEVDDLLQLVHDHLAKVPVPPQRLNPHVPLGLSDIILRLLEKEPDRRYQSAAGLVHDLSRLKTQLEQGDRETFPLAEHDFPLRLSPPSRPVGRESEIQALGTAFEDALRGNRRGVLVAGAPGVGKTTLANELRPLVTARRGWFITGKFDQYRRDQETDAVRQAFRMLARLLLAEPESEIAALRARFLENLGPNVGLAVTVVPELQVLLGVPAAATDGDPLKLEERAVQSALAMLRAVVSPARPIVMVIDDLQWGAQTPLAFFDRALSEENLDGLLLVGAYREAEVDAAHPVSAMLSRWSRLDTPPLLLPLRNLPPDAQGTLLEEMLRLPAAEAARLAAVIDARTQGNPYDTVELVNALRHDGALVPGEEGWTWNEMTIHRYIGKGDVVDHLSARIENLPPDARELLEVMACLGGEVELGLLQLSSGYSKQEVAERLEPVLDDGLVTVEEIGGSEARGVVRFRHDRVQQAAYGRLAVARMQTLHLAVARRLVDEPKFITTAAEQYLPAIQDIHSEDERRRVIGLFRTAASQALPINFAAAERFLGAATELLTPIATAADGPLLAALQTERHVALYNLNRFEEADELYHLIEQSTDSPARFESACIQICSLTSRNQPEKAVALGVKVLAELGLVVPPQEAVGAEIEKGLQELHRWASESSEAEDLQRPEVNDPKVTASARVINRMMPPAFFCNQTIMAWLVVQCHRLWVEHGPSAPLVGPLAHAPYIMISLHESYCDSYRIAKRVLAVSEARGYEPDASQARFLFALGTCHWFEPAEECVLQARRSREGLIRGGDLQNACFTFFSSTPSLFECAPTLETYLVESEAGDAFAARTGNVQAHASFFSFHQLGTTLRAELDPADRLGEVDFDEAQLARLAGNPTAIAGFHINHALAAMLMGNEQALSAHLALAAPLQKAVVATPPTRWFRLMQGLVLASEIKVAATRECPALLAELDELRDWFEFRASEAPGNFLHLLHLIEAERAWVLDDKWAAAAAFEAALREAAPQKLPWHRALITERAGLFHLTQGLVHTGRVLLSEARDLYGAWGATAKTRALEKEHFFLRGGVLARSGRDLQGTKEFSADSIDLLTIVRASQALSSETNLERLKARVIELLGAMTGATTILIALRDDPSSDWYLSGTTGEAPITVEEAGARGLIPLSVFRYVERTREPLLVEDATRDHRFSRDSYIAPLDCCSLMMVPVLNQGVPRALLLLENRLSSGTFSADRLDAVLLITGQLTVSLDNAQLYASLERKVADRTEDLRRSRDEMEDRVVERTRQLTNANRDLLEAKEEAERANEAKSQFLSRMSHELRTPMNAILGFAQILEMQPLTARQTGWVAQILCSGRHLLELIDDVLDITRSESGEMNFALEPVSVDEVVMQALDTVRPIAAKHGIQLEEPIVAGRVSADQARLRQALVNLLTNAVLFNRHNGSVTVKSSKTDDGRVHLAVIDTGAGISEEDRHKLFAPFERLQAERMGVEGTGLGLVIAKRLVEGMGGNITVESTVGQGSTFSVNLNSA